MTVIPNGIIVACHISRPLGAVSQAGDKTGKRPCPDTAVGGGQNRFCMGVEEPVTRAD